MRADMPAITPYRMEMKMPHHNSENHAAPAGAKDPTSEPTLLPMLIAGLVLVVIGAVVIMAFV